MTEGTRSDAGSKAWAKIHPIDISSVWSMNRKGTSSGIRQDHRLDYLRLRHFQQLIRVNRQREKRQSR